MAFTSTQQPVAAPLFSRAAAVIAAFRQARRDNRMFRKTLNELRSLSARELNDLGLSRSNIYEVAWSSVYKD